MNEKEKLNQNMNNLKEMIKEEVGKAYKQGYKDGTVLTCATLYRTFQIAGLEETNLLFTILKDLAKNNGCEDLKEKAEELKGVK